MFANAEERAMEERKEQKRIVEKVFEELILKGTFEKPDDIWGIKSLEDELQKCFSNVEMSESPAIRALYYQMQGERLARITRGDNGPKKEKLLYNDLVWQWISWIGWEEHCK